MARFGLYTELKLDESFRQHGTEAGALNLTLGFEPIKKLSVAFNWKPTLTLYNNNDVKTSSRHPMSLAEASDTGSSGRKTARDTYPKGSRSTSALPSTPHWEAMI